MSHRQEREVSPKIEIERKLDPRVEELEDRIADLAAQMFYSYILRKGLLKRGHQPEQKPVQTSTDS